MQVSVSSYSFAQLKKAPVEAVALAKELGFAAIEYTGVDKETALRVREAAERAGMPIISYAVWGNFLRTDISLEAEAERLCGEVDIAEILGVKKMRHDAAGGYEKPFNAYNSFDQALPVIAKGCRMVTEYAAKKGIATMIENHGYFCQDSLRVASLIGAVNHPNYGALVDIGNFLCADDNPAIACGNVAAMAKHVHAKDFHVKPGNLDNPGEGWFQSRAGNYLRGSIIGHGDVPIRQCLSILRRAGYDGYVSIEFEGMEDCLNALRIGKKNLEAFLT
jgi:sugar phosphate isomerase/epimerase